MFLLKICSLCFLLCMVESFKKWPSKFPLCSRNDPHLNECILKATETMKPYFKAGIPEFNIPSVAPYKIPEITIDQGSQSLQFKFILKDLILNGLDNYEFEKFNFDPKKLEFDCFLRVNEIKMNSNYEVQGKLLTIPIDGKGTFSNYFVNNSASLKQNVKIITKKGSEFLEVQDTQVKINVGPLQNYTYNGLFDGNEVLEKATRQVIDDNTELIIQELVPTVEKVITNIVLDIEKKILHTIPYDVLYPKELI